MMNEGRKINIFWTGGLDSTFRIVELSRCRCTIQPYYIIMKNKKSWRCEIKAIETISRILRKDTRTQALLLDPIFVDDEDIPRDSDTFDSWFRLMKGGSYQYYILAKFVNHLHIEMEMGLQFSPHGSIAKVIDETSLIPYSDDNYDVQIIDKTRASKDCLTVFGNFCFPKSLYHKNKSEEIEILRQEGYGNIVKHVWFCFDPLWGYPCGHCAPCISFEKEGVRLPYMGKMLYRIRGFFKKKKEDTSILKPNHQYVIQNVSDVYVASKMDLETGEVKKMFHVNETGVIILEAFQDGVGIDEIAKRLSDGFDVDFETAKREASAFIAKLDI